MTTPASTTRKEAIASGGSWRSPILAAMKLTAQTTTKIPMAAAIAGRPGARPVDEAILTESNQSFFPDGQFFDQVEPRLETDSGSCGNANRPLWRRDREQALFGGRHHRSGSHHLATKDDLRCH